MKEYTDKGNKVKFMIVFLVIWAVQMAAAFYFCVQKQGFHEDEYYTYYSTARTNGVVGCASADVLLGVSYSGIHGSRSVLEMDRPYSKSGILGNQYCAACVSGLAGERTKRENGGSGNIVLRILSGGYEWGGIYPDV